MREANGSAAEGVRVGAGEEGGGREGGRARKTALFHFTRGQRGQEEGGSTAYLQFRRMMRARFSFSLPFPRRRDHRSLFFCPFFIALNDPPHFWIRRPRRALFIARGQT